MGTQGAGAQAREAGEVAQLPALDRRAAEWAADRAARRAAAEIARAALTATTAETAAHSDDVDVIAEGLCSQLGVAGPECDDILLAARLHDIGKVSIPESILQKQGQPDAGEWKVLRKHTVVGEDIVRAVPELAAVATLVRHSHERWDGGGYPDGLVAKEIPLGSRIIFCADAFHAIRSDRPYRAGRSAGAALSEIRAASGSQFDPTVVAALEALTRETQQAAGLSHRLNPRSNRLVALLLVLSTGAAAAAIARTGLLGEPEVPAAGASANPPATAAPLPGLPAFAIGGDPAKAAICTGCVSGPPQGLLASPLSAFGLDGRGKKGEPSAQAVGGPAGSTNSHGGGSLGDGAASHSGGGKAGSDSGGGSSATAPPVGGEGNNGVRDHGAGEGRDGHGQGKGQGDTNGNGHEGLADGSPIGGGAGADAGGSGGQPNGHGGPHDAPPPPSADTSISTPLDTTSPSAVGKGHGGGRHGRA